MDVDDFEVLDKYNRLVCLVFVRYNSTHLLNVNMAPLSTGLATANDYPNKFNPTTWTLFIYYPEGALPDTYDGLLQVYLQLQSSYLKLKTNYDKLKSEYDRLTVDYSSLKSVYSELKADYDILKVDYDV